MVYDPSKPAPRNSNVAMTEEPQPQVTRPLFVGGTGSPMPPGPMGATAPPIGANEMLQNAQLMEMFKKLTQAGAGGGQQKPSQSSSMAGGAGGGSITGTNMGGM